jgi:KDO2-lipid IV(A) lauroyltransferase
VSGKEHLEAALAAGRGAILALPHSGNWDMAGVWLVQANGMFTTVAERLKPESLYRRFLDYRESLGFEVLPLTGGERPAYEVLVERLQANRVVCLMAERDLSRSRPVWGQYRCASRGLAHVAAAVVGRPVR